jgi:chromate transporter
VVGVVLNLAIWFALHTLFGEVRPFEAGPLDFDVPVPASLDWAALLLAAAAMVAVFRLKLGTLWVLAGCAAAGLALSAAGIA